MSDRALESLSLMGTRFSLENEYLQQPILALAY